MKNSEKLNDLEKLSKEAKKLIVKISAESKAPHTGSCLSIIDILISIYFDVFANELKPNTPESRRPFIILSKGHAIAALYSVLYLKGYINKEEIYSYHKNGGLPGHADTSVNGIDFSTGSLGHGLSIGVGAALANKIDKKKSKIIVILGDGECQEGSVWEAANFAAKHLLENLLVIVDNNGLQGYSKTDSVSAGYLEHKWASFGWETIKIDGHDFSSIREGIMHSFYSKKPLVILAQTIKGKGIQNLENKIESHYLSPLGNEFGD
jgi:transketolase